MNEIFRDVEGDITFGCRPFRFNSSCNILNYTLQLSLFVSVVCFRCFASFDFCLSLFLCFLARCFFFVCLLVLLIHMSIIRIYAMSRVRLAGRSLALHGKTLITLDITCKPVNHIFVIPAMLTGIADIILFHFTDLYLAWCSQGQRKAQSIGFFFLQIFFYLISIKFYVVMKRFKLNISRLLVNNI